MCRPGLTVANDVAYDRKGLTEFCFPRHRWGSLTSRSFARRPLLLTGSKGLASAKRLSPVLSRCCFMAGFCVKLAKVSARTDFFPFALPNRVVETPNAAADAFV